MRKATYMIGVSMFIYTTLLVAGMIKHVTDPTWPLHARFHVLQSHFSSAGLGLLSLFILLTAFQRRETWAWWALLVSWAMMFAGGFWLSVAITGDGPPGVRTWFTTAAFTIWTGVGLALSRKEMLGSATSKVHELESSSPVSAPSTAAE